MATSKKNYSDVEHRSLARLPILEHSNFFSSLLTETERRVLIVSPLLIYHEAHRRFKSVVEHNVTHR